MPRLNGHIAAGTEAKTAFEKIKGETYHVFKGKDIFFGVVKEYKPRVDGEDLTEGERKEVIATVKERLDWTNRPAMKVLDFEATRENTNTIAKADLEVDGVVLIKDVPATVLLGLESKLKAIRDYYDAVPTLDLSKKWEETGDRGIKKCGPSVTYRTKKKTIPIVLMAATKEHPAQVKAEVEDIIIGQFESTYFSGAAHPGDKANWLIRLDKLIEAVKRAQTKANEVEIQAMPIGEILFKFVHAADK